MIQKALAFAAQLSGTVSVPGAISPVESCPAGLLAIAGLRWWRRQSPSQPNGGFRETDRHPTAATGSRFAARADCAAADAVMAGEYFQPIEPAPLAGLRLGIPQGLLLRDLDETVAARFSAATALLRKGDARLTDEPFGLLDEMVAANKRGTIAPTEGYAIHRDLLEKRGQDYDPIVHARFEAARNVSAADYIALMRERARLIRAMDARLEDVDAIVLPTMKIVPPKISEVATLEGFLAKNALVGPNANWVNFFDLCAISSVAP
jgi:aspartyl-tRNA(Asn)/glutamyl-tRNA(Gln) amidotransferase subunit A